MARIKLTEQQLQYIISEAIQKRVLKEEKSEDIDNKIVNLISYLHNSQKDLRELHWNTRELAMHSVTDESIGDVLGWEDGLAETFISDTNKELLINETKPSEKDFKKILSELCDMCSNIKERISGNKEYDNICAVIDEILEKSNQLLYKGQLN